MCLCLERLVIPVSIMFLDYALYVYPVYQIHYLFKNRLSDKFYFRNFTHVVIFCSQTKSTTFGGTLRSDPLS